MLERILEKKGGLISEASVEGLMAPCKPNGEANTLDEETKDGCCDCPTHHCLINYRNIVIQQTRRSEPQV